MTTLVFSALSFVAGFFVSKQGYLAFAEYLVTEWVTKTWQWVKGLFGSK